MTSVKIEVSVDDSSLHVNANDSWVSITIQGHSGSCASADRIHGFGPGIWWLARLLIQSEYRQRGLGTMLTKKLQSELLKKPDFEGLIVEPGGYGSDIDRLYEFYKRLGFQSHEDGGLIWRKP